MAEPPEPPPRPDVPAVVPVGPDQRLPEPGWGRSRLRATAPDLVDQVGFSRAPQRFSSAAFPPEVRQAMADLWDAMAAEVVDEVRIHGVASVRTRSGRRRLWTRLERVMNRAQQLVIYLGHSYPMPVGRWGHRSAGSIAAGGIAVGEQVLVGTSLFAGPSSPLVVAVVGAVMTEMLEIYFVASARMERYRFAARRPSAATIAADLGAIYGGQSNGTGSADRRVVEEALRMMLSRVVRRSKWRFGEALAIGVGPAAAGFMTGSAVVKAQRPALRDPDELERNADAADPGAPTRRPS
ncbi:MAG TPA: hypothetical protein VM121_06485 [Acidimicrobiales bacterium]|nr:hypothetical protein [Acidimicrobiales bacterium]